MRLFIVMLAALLPLALVHVAATVQLQRNASEERARLLAVGVDESARRIAERITFDVDFARNMAARVADGEDAITACASVQRRRALIDRGVRIDMRFALGDPAAMQLCGIDAAYRPGGALADPDAIEGAGSVLQGNIAYRLLPDRGLEVVDARPMAMDRFRIFYPTESLLAIADPLTHGNVARLEIHGGSAILLLEPLPVSWQRRLDRRIVSTGAIGPLDMVMRYAAPVERSPELIALALPFLTVLAAAVIAWLVADRLILGPVTALRGRLAAYQTGDRMAPSRWGTLDAAEIAELEDSFIALTHRVADDKHALDAGIERQVGLTREVHHRVKNNVQIISSLINLHARQRDDDVSRAAYLDIQRRVDALAVVQRHHQAHAEANTGLALRTLVSELLASFRLDLDGPGSTGRVTLAIGPERVDQDVASPVAFLLTEILDLIEDRTVSGDLSIGTAPSPDVPGKVRLSIAARVFAADGIYPQGIDQLTLRVFEGFSRQLQTALLHDPVLSTLSLDLRVLAEPAPPAAVAQPPVKAPPAPSSPAA